jgi:raffinose/stachyose/melibiose transport system substrate-binding protein
MWAASEQSGWRVRAAVAVAAVVAAVALAACGGGSDGSGGGGTSSAKHVTVTVWDWDYFPDGLKPYLAKVDRAFMAAHPNVTVRHVGIPYPDAPQKLHAAVASRRGPDVVTLYAGAYAAPYKQGLLAIEDRISSAQRADWQFLDDAVLPDGHTYVVPFATDGYVMAYNKQLFARAHLTPPTSWSGLLAACDKLKAAGIVPISGGWKDGEHLDDWFQQLSDELLTPSDRKAFFAANLALNGPKFKQALGFWQQLNARGCFDPNSSSRTHDDAINAFAAGRAGMILQFLAFGPLSKEGLYPKNLGIKNVGVFPVPLVPGSPYTQFLDAVPRSGWAITKWAKDPDAAWQYVSWVMRAQSFKVGWNTVGVLPNLRSYTPTATGDPLAAQYLKWLKWPSNASTYTAYPEDVLDIFIRQAVPLATGAVKPADVLGAMQQQEQQDRPELTG